MRSLLDVNFTWIGILLNGIAVLLLIGSLSVNFRVLPEERRKGVRILSFFTSLFSFLLVLTMMDCAFSERGKSFDYHYLSLQQLLFDLPWIIYLLLEGIIFLLILHLSESYLRFRKAYLTADSIRQTLNFMPEGILISDEKGTVWLSNLQMGALCRDLTGAILSNAERFWAFLEEHNIGNGEDLLIRIGEEVWLFEKTVIHVQNKNYYQIIAGNVTDWYRIIEELNEKSEHLKEIQRRMKEAADLSADMFVAQEQAKARVALHNQLGQVLLMGRHFLLHPESSDPDMVFTATAEMNRFLLGEKRREDEFSVDHLQRAISMAGSIGVRVKLLGTVPEEENVLLILGLVITECAANTVKHAAGDLVTVEFTEEGAARCFRVTNNGRVPKGEIAESGGLLALRRKIEELGGSMRLDSHPAFVLTIRL